MKQIMLSAEALAVLNITADAADATAVNNAIAQLAAKAQKVETLQTELTTTQNKLREVEEATATVKAEALVDTAVAANKIVAGEKPKWVKLAKADYEGTKEVLDGMQAAPTMQHQMEGGPAKLANEARLAELSKKTGKELYMEGLLEELKGLSMEVFKAKYKQYFGSDYPLQ